jgi:mannosyltransferase
MSDRKQYITLDGTIFGLQAFGGISNYWGRLVQYIDKQSNLKSHLVIPSYIRYSDYNSSWHINSTIRKDLLPNSVSRYLDVPIDEKCDVFHTSYFRVPKKKPYKYVVTVYDFIYERYRTGPARWVHSWQKLRSIRMADDVICISHATREDVLRYLPDINPARVHTVYLGVDQNAFFPEHSDRATKLEKMVLYVGQRSKYKRFDLAIKAVEQCIDLSLGIVGPPLEGHEIEMLESRLRGRWNSFGPVSSSNLRVLYSTAFAFIFPSDYEGFGLPILEAMACGCPVVASSASSLPEVGGAAAIYAIEQSPEAYAFGLKQLLNSVSTRNDAISAGFHQANLFTWSRTFDQTISIYQG